MDTDLAQPSAPTAFFGRTYDEALSLLQEAQAYLTRLHPIGSDLRDPLDTLVVRAEALRLSSRLMQVTAWLLTQRAVHNGELDAETVATDPQYRLGSRTVCRDDSAHLHPAIPAALSDLLERSLNLYIRIERLDEMQRRTLH